MGHKSFEEAIMFFNSHGLCKQMLYSEFDAILDGIVLVQEFASQTVKGAYVRVAPSLTIQSVVLFYLTFNEEGRADCKWNIPVQHMAEVAGRGPDLGDGHIRIACRTQCPVSWHQRLLWDPKPSAINELVLIKAALKRNKLRFYEDYVEPSPPQQPQQKPAAKQLSSVQGYQQQLQALRDQLDQRIENQQLKHENSVAKLDLELMELKSQLKKAEHEAKQYRQQLVQKNQEYQTSRKEMTRLLQDIEAQNQNRLADLKESITKKVEAKYRSQLNELRDLVKAKDVEISYLEDIDKQQQLELERLQQENKQLKITHPGDVLAQLAAKGVMFMAYHPGVGHVTIPVKDVDEYLADNIAYVAKRCFVSKEHYLSWRRHYENATCDATVSGKRCGQPIARVEVPREFEADKSNMCVDHQKAEKAEQVESGQPPQLKVSR
ncbi:hypothetical protein H0A36_24735 [Endozoicomonas sp. SM1973]|uniref:Uncharacterized protein n=1 Tax=Spartinivicinus marinus TaxID=2994442 RepID=A0A853I8Q7_9GAMM|nr:hypothetical protein [Spartinivicinus marinus]MCX4024951.1 hypothetical protein [Spartinivicinus marinus]NYZ69229.1 hypothetical protein [Spartinivicinus marinus]